jgi:tetraacyldisaccharide 4'-kinase
VSAPLARAAAAIVGAAWELRRRAYAAGLARPRRVPARVVSIGNLTVGGTGKTTLTLHLAERARARGIRTAVVCRRYRPGPGGRGDEEALYRERLGAGEVFAGRRKRDLAARAAAAGFRLVLVDDAFSHWGLERDLDLVVLDARDLWGGGLLIPAGRLREPRRALQRARVVVVSRLGPAEDPAPMMAEARGFAPGALIAAARHRVRHARTLAGGPVPAGGRARVVTATGNPRAVEASAREAGFDVVALSAYRDHHWFDGGEARREIAAARAAGAVVLLTAKDAVRWPPGAAAADVRVLEIEWEWHTAGEAVVRLVLEGEGPGGGEGADGSEGAEGRA